MLKNNKLNMVIAFVLAISLWAYVLDATKVTSTETIRNVPIDFINENILQEDQLVVLNKGVDTINIVVSGERSIVSKIKTRDFKVICDLSNAVLGENNLPINVTEYPASVKIESISDMSINVSVDVYKEASKNVEAVCKTELGENQEVVIQDVEAEKVLVKGPSILVDKVAKVNAVFKGKELFNGSSQVEAKLIPVNKSGKEVEGVELSEYRTNVTAKIIQVKTVPLYVSITGMDEDTYEYTIKKPEKVVITGDKDVIDKVESIESSLSLAGIIKSSRLVINPILPSGISVSLNQSPLYAEVTISKKGEPVSPPEDENDDKDKKTKEDEGKEDGQGDNTKENP